MKHYSLDRILKYNADYYIIYGIRSTGKTYASLMHGLKKFIEGKGKLCYIRRWQEDFKKGRGQRMFDGIVANGEISRLTGGEWTGVKYYNSQWFLTRWDEDTQTAVVSPDSFGVAVALDNMEHDKSGSFPDVSTIIFDEFIPKDGIHYLTDEYIVWMNCLSTIIRDRDGVEIFMLANSINNYSPYYTEMGLSHIKNQKPNTIDVYQQGEHGAKCVVEFTENIVNRSKNNRYFSFDNPKLNMITGDGNGYQLDLFPHSMRKYSPEMVLFSFFVCFDNEIFQGDVVKDGCDLWVFIHRKTTPIQHPDKDIIYSTEDNPGQNYHRKITVIDNAITRFIWRQFGIGKVFYQDNTVGMAVQNYIDWCRKN